jgi:hypothetical protein
MARSKRRTVIVVLVATLLASAGAGTYYATTRDGAWPAGLFGSGALVADDASTTTHADLSHSDLDAVATAWGGSDATATAAPIAAEPSGDSRYSYSTDSTSEDADDDSSLDAAADTTPVMLPAAPSQEVTRGQEPIEQAAYQSNAAGPPNANPSDDGSKDDAIVDADSTRRAREAFADDLAGVPSPQPTASDRYNGLAAADQAPAATHGAAAAADPFASAASPAEPARMAPPADPHPADLRTANAYHSIPQPETHRGGSDPTQSYPSKVNHQPRWTKAPVDRASGPSKVRSGPP